MPRLISLPFLATWQLVLYVHGDDFWGIFGGQERTQADHMSQHLSWVASQIAFCTDVLQMFHQKISFKEKLISIWYQIKCCKYNLLAKTTTDFHCLEHVNDPKCRKSNSKRAHIFAYITTHEEECDAHQYGIIECE